MDNNAAERGLRGAVIGRRLSFGSDSEDGADFTAMMYRWVGTLSMHGIDVLRCWRGGAGGMRCGAANRQTTCRPGYHGR